MSVESSRRLRRRIYTRRGDSGETALVTGPRVLKDHHRIQAVGEIDELSSVIGMARVEPLPPARDALLRRVQVDLMRLAAELANGNPTRLESRCMLPEDIEWLEQEIDRLEFGLIPLQQFVLPGGCRSAATLHWARTVCRRAERSVVTVMRKEPPVSPSLLIYLNRLADLLFVLARCENNDHGTEEFP